MKLEDLRPGVFMLGALGVAGLAATALLGFAAGVAYSRDPASVRRTARRVAGEVARGVERATLLAAQAREHLGDLWAEAREEALAEVDARDFERTARAAAPAPDGAGAAAEAAAAPAGKRARRGARKTTRRAAGPAKSAAPNGDAGD